MLGEHYLATRRELAELTSAIRELAQQTRTNADGISAAGLKDYLQSPFRIVVCGEPEAGKTKFLESLLRVELDGEQSLNIYGSPVLWTGGRSEQIEYIQKRDIGEIEVIDSAGISKLNDAELTQLKELMSEADFVFWVLSSDNPWAAKTWDMVTEMRDVLVGRNAVILQQIDRRKTKDIPILLDHLNSLSVQRIGKALPMYCVSAEQAKQAWQEGTVDKRLWKKSGYDALVTSLNQTLNSGEERRAALRHVHELGNDVLERIEQANDGRSRALATDKRVLQDVEAQIDQAREEEVRSARENIASLGSILGEQVRPATRFASRKNSFISTLIALFGRGDGAIAIERQLNEDVSEYALYRGRELGYNLLEKCREHWQEIRSGLQGKMAVDIVDFDQATFEKRVDTFSEQIQKSTRHAMVHLKLRRLLDDSMVARQNTLKKWMMVFLSLLTVAGFTGYLESSKLGDLPLYLLIASGAVLIGMFLYSVKTAREVVDDYGETVNDARSHLAEILSEPYIDEVREFYTGYIPMFQNIRNYIVDAQRQLMPQQKKWHELFLAMKAVEQEL